MGVNVLHPHVRDTMVILEEGNLPHPWCPRCDIMVPFQDLNIKHLYTTQCSRGAEQKRRWLV